MKRKMKQQHVRFRTIPSVYIVIFTHTCPHFDCRSSAFGRQLRNYYFGIHNVCELFFSLHVVVLLLLFCSVLLSRVIVFSGFFLLHSHATLKLIVVIVVVLRCGLLDWLANIFLFILRFIAFWCQMFASSLCWDLVQFYSLLSSR